MVARWSTSLFDDTLRHSRFGKGAAVILRGIGSRALGLCESRREVRKACTNVAWLCSTHVMICGKEKTASDACASEAVIGC